MFIRGKRKIDYLTGATQPPEKEYEVAFQTWDKTQW